MSLWVHLVVEIWHLEDGKVIVPELDARIEHQPALSGLLAEFDGSDYVVEELLLLFSKLLLLLWSEFSLILVILYRD